MSFDILIMNPIGHATVALVPDVKLERLIKSNADLPKTTHFSVESGYSCALTSDQLEIRNQILFAEYTMPFHGVQKDSLFPDIVPYTITYTINELYQYIIHHIPNAKNSTLFLSGGAACHILSRLEYADLDLSMYLPTSGINFKELTLGFFHDKLIKLNPQFKNSRTPAYISQNYLTDYLDLAGNFVFFGLGLKIQLKFINNQAAHRHNIAITDGFHIAMLSKDHIDSEDEIKNYSAVYCIDRTLPGDIQHYHKALETLSKRQLIIYEPETARELALRTIHKCTLGFTICEKLIPIALSKLIEEYPLEKIESFQNRFNKHQKNHYSDNIGRSIDFLNMLMLISHMKFDERKIYLEALCDDKISLPITIFISSLKAKPELLNTLLEYVHGAYYLAWIHNSPGFSGYPVFGQTLNEISHVQPHLHLTHTFKGVARYIYVAKNPFELSIAFLKACYTLKNLNISAQHCISLLNQFEIFIPYPLSNLETTTQLILDAVQKSPFTLILRNFKIASTQFYEAISKENFDCVNQENLELRIQQSYLTQALGYFQNTRQTTAANVIKNLKTVIQNGGSLDALCYDLEKIEIDSLRGFPEVLKVLYEQLLQMFSDPSKLETNTSILLRIYHVFGTDQQSTLAYLLIHHYRFQNDWEQLEHALPTLKFLKAVLSWKNLSQTLTELLVLFNCEILNFIIETISESTERYPVKANSYLQVLVHGHQWQQRTNAFENWCYTILDALTTQHESIIDITTLIMRIIPIERISFDNGLQIIKKLFRNTSKLDETRKTLTEFLSAFVPHHVEKTELHNLLLTYCEECLSSPSIDTDEKNYSINLFVDKLILLKNTPQELHSHLNKFKRTLNRTLFISIIAKMNLIYAHSLFIQYCNSHTWNKLSLVEETDIRHGLIVQFAKTTDVTNIPHALKLWNEGKDSREALPAKTSEFIIVGLQLLSSLIKNSEGHEILIIGYDVLQLLNKDVNNERGKLLNGLKDLVVKLVPIDSKLAGEYDDLLVTKGWIQEKLIKKAETDQQKQNIFKAFLDNPETVSHDQVVEYYLSSADLLNPQILEQLYRCALKIVSTKPSDQTCEKLLIPLLKFALSSSTSNSKLLSIQDEFTIALLDSTLIPSTFRKMTFEILLTSKGKWLILAVNHLPPAQQISESQWNIILSSREALTNLYESFLQGNSKITAEHLKSAYVRISSVNQHLIGLYKCSIKILNDSPQQPLSTTTFNNLLFPLFKKGLADKKAIAETFVKQMIACVDLPEGSYLSIIDALIEHKAVQLLSSALTTQHFLQQATLPTFDRYSKIYQFACSTSDPKILINAHKLFQHAQKHKWLRYTCDHIAWLEAVIDNQAILKFAPSLILEDIDAGIWKNNDLFEGYQAQIAIKLVKYLCLHHKKSDTLKKHLDLLVKQGLFQALQALTNDLRLGLFRIMLNTYSVPFYDLALNYLKKSFIVPTEHSNKLYRTFAEALITIVQKHYDPAHQDSTVSFESFWRFFKLTPDDFVIPQISNDLTYESQLFYVAYFTYTCELYWLQNLPINHLVLIQTVPAFFHIFWGKHKSNLTDLYQKEGDKIIKNAIMLAGSIIQQLNCTTEQQASAVTCITAILNAKFCKTEFHGKIAELVNTPIDGKNNLRVVSWQQISSGLEERNRYQFLEQLTFQLLLNNQIKGLVESLEIAKSLSKDLFYQFQRAVVQQICMVLDPKKLSKNVAADLFKEIPLTIKNAAQMEAFINLLIALLPPYFVNDADIWHHLYSTALQKHKQLSDLKTERPEVLLALTKKIQNLQQKIDGILNPYKYLKKTINRLEVNPNTKLTAGTAAQCKHDKHYCELLVQESLDRCLDENVFTVLYQGDKISIEVQPGRLHAKDVSAVFIILKSLLTTSIKEKIYNIDLLVRVLRTYKNLCTQEENDEFEILVSISTQRDFL